MPFLKKFLKIPSSSKGANKNMLTKLTKAMLILEYRSDIIFQIWLFNWTVNGRTNHRIRDEIENYRVHQIPFFSENALKKTVEFFLKLLFLFQSTIHPVNNGK